VPPWRSRRSLEDRLTWLLGSPRTGSTWLTNLLASSPAVDSIGEPHIGMHLAPFTPVPYQEPMPYLGIQGDRPGYFFNDEFASAWRPGLRDLILERLGAQVGDAPVVVVKEPHGSQAAELLLSLFPRSRLLFLIRDGRDVVDSELSAYGPEGWLGRGLVPQMSRLQLAEYLAKLWLVRTEAVQAAFAAHAPALRCEVRYEDLLADTPGELARLYEWLGVASPPDLERRVDELSFERQATGAGSFYRAATPGLWRTSLSGEEGRAITEILGPKLDELGYER
jgi:hypothetical protein